MVFYGHIVCSLKVALNIVFGVGSEERGGLQTMRKFILWVLLCASLCGCSVGMAMSGKENPQLGAVRVGATRGEIELHLGPPIQTRSVDDKRIDTYEYEVGIAFTRTGGRARDYGCFNFGLVGSCRYAS